MQAVLFRVWTRVTKFTSYDDNCYATSAKSAGLKIKESEK